MTTVAPTSPSAQPANHDAWLANALREAAWAPMAVVLVYAIAAKLFHAYLRWPNLDIPTHLCGGLAMAYFVATVAKHAQAVTGPIPKVIRMLLAFGLTTVTAVVWEFIEFECDTLLGTEMNLGVSDTLSDLFFGLVGALAALVVMAKAQK